MASAASARIDTRDQPLAPARSSVPSLCLTAALKHNKPDALNNKVSGEWVNIDDAYADARFNPEVDRQTGYKTRNLLTLPMKGRDGRTLGVLQVLNKRHGPFLPDDVEILSALASSAALAVEEGPPPGSP